MVRWSRAIGRWIVAVLVLAAIVAAILPFSVQTGAGASSVATCVPVLQAWKGAPARPTAADMAILTTAGAPTPVNVHDPRYRAIIATKVMSPAYLRVVRWVDWAAGPGACVAHSRGRVHLSEGLLIGAGVLAVGLLLVDRRRTMATAWV